MWPRNTAFPAVATASAIILLVIGVIWATRVEEPTELAAVEESGGIPEILASGTTEPVGTAGTEQAAESGVAPSPTGKPDKTATPAQTETETDDEAASASGSGSQTGTDGQTDSAVTNDESAVSDSGASDTEVSTEGGDTAVEEPDAGSDETDSAEVAVATCDVAAPASAGLVVSAWYTCEATGELIAVSRVIADQRTPFTATVRTLVAGPTEAERAVGITSGWSAATADVVQSVNLRRSGQAIVELSADAPELLAAGTPPEGFADLFGSLQNTVFQFDRTTEMVVWIDGSCEAFGEWSGLGGCPVFPKP